jgi:hypothetical protein
MEDVNENTELGQRMYQVAQQGGISDFYITPWEPLCYKQNGELIYDSYVYTPTVEWQVTPGCLDYAVSFAGMRFRVNRLVTRGEVSLGHATSTHGDPVSMGYCSSGSRGESVLGSKERLVPHMRGDW